MLDKRVFGGAIGLGAILVTLAAVGCGRGKSQRPLPGHIVPPPPPPLSHPGWQPGAPRPKHYLMVEGERAGEQPSILGAGAGLFSVPRLPDADEATQPMQLADAATPGFDTGLPPVKPYRTWIQIQRYQVENSGEGLGSISNVRLVITFPGPTEKGTVVELPGGGQYWPIGNGQVQEINRTFELPFKYIQKDGFQFRIQMIRKGAWIKPCEFDVVQLSQFNRSYVCRTDVEWQKKRGIPEEKLDKESLQIRVLTDLELPKRQLPTDAIAIAP